MDPKRPESADSPHAWSVHDGRAGNARQADALARQLSPAVVDCTLAPRAPWRWLAPRRLPGDAAAFGTAFSASLATPPDLAVGCGRQAALATRLLRERGTRTVQVLDPRVDPAHWDLVVVPEHDALRGDNVLTLLGSLHPVDDAWLADARSAFAALEALPRPRTAVLVGGPGPHARFGSVAFDALLAAVARLQAIDGGSVLATTSRRTPADLRATLRTHFAGMPALVWTDVAEGANPYAGLLAWADRIVCTPDSVNMLSEACATRVPVFVTDPSDVEGGPRRFVDALLARGRVRLLGDAGGRADVAVEPLRETARIAAQVRERLGLP